MRKSTSIVAPVFVLTSYYVVLLALVWAAIKFLPGASGWLPLGGLEDLIERDSGQLELFGATERTFVAQVEALTLALATLGAVLLMTPISWVYFMTTRSSDVDRSFAQTIIVLPVIVAGIALIVQNSLALAFSLAGVVAAVRFRFSLSEPAHALYIFVAIAVGLGAGIGALDISFVTSVAFVYVNLVLWRLDYGAQLTSRFFAFLTGRGRDDDAL